MCSISQCVSCVSHVLVAAKNGHTRTNRQQLRVRFVCNAIELCGWFTYKLLLFVRMDGWSNSTMVKFANLNKNIIYNHTSLTHYPIYAKQISFRNHPSPLKRSENIDHIHTLIHFQSYCKSHEIGVGILIALDHKRDHSLTHTHTIGIVIK